MRRVLGVKELRFIRVVFLSVCLRFAFREKAHRNANHKHTDRKTTRIKTITGPNRGVKLSPLTWVAGEARAKLSAPLRCSEDSRIDLHRRDAESAELAEDTGWHRLSAG